MFLKRTDFFDGPPASSQDHGSSEGEGIHDERLQASLKLLGRLARASKREDLVERVKITMAHLAQERFSVAVVGEFNRGKSTLINELLGQETVPTGATPTTRVPIRVIGGSRERIVAPLSSGRRVYPLSEEGWDNLGRDTAEELPPYLVVRSACPLLFGGDLELVDTPGVNSQLAADFTFADQALVGCDCAILVVSAVTPMSELEGNLLREYLVDRQIPRVMVVLTMLDLVGARERAALVEHVRGKVRAVSAGCPLFLSQEGLVEGWDGPAGADAISSQLLTWLGQSGHKELRLRRAWAEAVSIARGLRNLYGLRLAALDEGRAGKMRERCDNEGGPDVDWKRLEVELLERCNKNFERIQRVSSERQRDVLERFSLELSHSNNPKGWYELDYPYRMKSELISFGNILENMLQKCYGRDITWLNHELQSRYDVKVPPEVAGIADRELFRRPIRQANAGLSDMTKVRAASRLGAGVVAVGSIALSVVPMAQVPAMALRGLSLCITPMAEVALGKATDHQRHILEGVLERDVPKIYARCVSSVEESVRSVYLSAYAELEGACASWAEAKASACEDAGETPKPERERERLARVISELDAIIEGH